MQPAELPYSRHTISVAEPRIVHSFSCHVPSREIRTVPLKTSGAVLNAAPYDKLAIMFAHHNNIAEMFELTPLWANYVSIQTPGPYLGSKQDG
jgi:hypothetical protein